MSSVLTIAGSDPSGGAGIQSDLRTFAALGVDGLSAITALTVQNSQGVRSVHPVAPEILAAQLNAVLEDTRPEAVKIGMLGGAAQVQVVAEALRRFRPLHVVLDPVLASTGGVPLLDAMGLEALRAELLPWCELVTPNVAEAEALTGVHVQDAETAQAAGERLRTFGVAAALIKGGHLPGPPVDRLVTASGLQTFPGRRVETPHTHGTGCLLSSAIAAGLASDRTLPEAVADAKRLLTEALQHPIVIGQGRGYPGISAL